MAKDEIGRLGIVQEILRKSTDVLRLVIAPVGGRGGVTFVVCLPASQQVSAGGLHLVGIDRTTAVATTGRRGTAAGGARCVEAHTNGERQTGVARHKRGRSDSFSGRAPQGLCDNLINVLKLLNQQEDGDGPIQSIVTGLCKRSRKGLTEGLRNFIQVDNHRALVVGYLREVLGSFKVREEGYPEVKVRESPDEMTLGAEEVCSWTSCINVDHIEKEK